MDDETEREFSGDAKASAVDRDANDWERLKIEAAEANDRALRAQAELENVRKRSRREMEDERKYADLPLLRDLLPVVDNLQRAIAAAEKSAEASQLLTGIKMVASTLDGALSRHNCKRIEATDQPFDPAFHEAVMQQAKPGVPAHTVIAVVQDGYLLHDRVIRPAQVIVSST